MVGNPVRSILGLALVWGMTLLSGPGFHASGAAAQSAEPVSPDARSRASVAPEPGDGLLPRTCLWTLDVSDTSGILEAMARAQRLFSPRSAARRSETPDVVGDNVEWLPYLPAAAALVHTLELPYHDAMRIDLARHLARARGPAALGLLPLEDRSRAPVVVFTFDQAELPSRPPQGLHAETVGRYRILSTSQAAADRVRAYLAARRPAGETRPDQVGSSCLRLRPSRLDLVSPGVPQLPWSLLKYFVGRLPEELEIRWEPEPANRASPGESGDKDRAGIAAVGRETVRIRGGELARHLRPCSGTMAPQYIYCSLRLRGRVAMPEAVHELWPRVLDVDPFRLGMTLLRAWPGSVPQADLIARNLTGQFQVLVLHSSPDMVPVVGFELVSPTRARAVVERHLVATGLCDRERRDPIPFTYPLRIPDFLRRNRMLQHLFQRWNAQPPRRYLLAVAGRQLWLGPEEEVKEVLMALRDEGDVRPDGRARAPAGVPDGVPRAARGEPASCGRLIVTPAALWDDLVFEHGRRARDNDFAPAWERPLKESIGDLVKRLALQDWSVSRDGKDVVLTRRVSPDRSLVTALAAYGYLAYRSVYLIEERIRTGARQELGRLAQALETYRHQHGRLATVDDLDRLGLWNPGGRSRARHVEAYHFGVAPAPDASGARATRWTALYALSRETGPSGPRPSFLLLPDGTLWSGAVTRSDLARILEEQKTPSPPRWQRVED